MTQGGAGMTQGGVGMTHWGVRGDGQERVIPAFEKRSDGINDISFYATF